MSNRGRPKIRDKEYWKVYVRLKQREFRAKKAKDTAELAGTRKLLDVLKLSEHLQPPQCVAGMERRRCV